MGKTIPKKRSRKDEEFNLDCYIEEETMKFSKKIRKDARKEFSLLEKLTDAFVNHLETTTEKSPFTYEYTIHAYQLTFLEKKAIEIFIRNVSEKGYTASSKMLNLDPDDYYPYRAIVITVK